MEAQPSHRECFFSQILVNFQSFRLPRNLSLEVYWPDMNFLMPLLLNRSVQFLFSGIEEKRKLARGLQGLLIYTYGETEN